MSNNNNNQALKSPAAWRGYTIDELRHRYLLNQVRIEVERERLESRVHRFYSRKNSEGQSHGLIHKMLSGFSIIDYGILAFQMTKSLRKFYKLIRRK